MPSFNLTATEIDSAIKASLVEQGFTAPVKSITFNKVTKLKPRSVTVEFGEADEAEEVTAEVVDTPETLSFPE